MKREFSAGGIVCRKSDSGDFEVLLIQNQAMRDPAKTYWGFPKGHINPGELSKDAALREVKEETNLDVEVVEKINDSKYVFTHEGEKIFKVVTIYLMKFVSGEIKFQEEELLSAKWVKLDEALGKLSFSNDKKILQQAKAALERS